MPTIFLFDKLAIYSRAFCVDRILRDGGQPKRTFYIAFGHDEEVSTSHRRRMETKAKVKVVASVWGGGGMYSISCCASCFALVDLEEKKRMFREN